QQASVETMLDAELLPECLPALEHGEQVTLKRTVHNVHRSIGALLSGEVARRYGEAGLPDATLHLELDGSAGQSFGAWLAAGITLTLRGEANDYVGKGLSGGRLVIRPPLHSQRRD